MSAPASCWVGACHNTLGYVVRAPWLVSQPIVDTCSAHLGDLLGNLARTHLKGASSVTLQVEPRPEV